MRSILSTVGELIGAALVAVGAGMAWPPAGVMVAGVAVLAMSFQQGEL